jgi:hypothetical protein
MLQETFFTETFCYVDVLSRRRFVEETFCAETFCMCADAKALEIIYNRSAQTSDLSLADYQIHIGFPEC